MTGKKLEFTIFPSRAAAARQLQSRCAKKSAGEPADLWKNAWQHFQMESSYFIKPEKCFPKSDPKAKINVSVWRIKYRALTIKHFLPYFKDRVKLVSGKAKKQLLDSISLLEEWKNHTPESLWAEEVSTKKKEIIKFPKPQPPTQLQLPRPPQKHISIRHAERVLHDVQGNVSGLSEELELSDDDCLNFFWGSNSCSSDFE